MGSLTFFTAALVVMATLVIGRNEACQCYRENGTTVNVGDTIGDTINNNCGSPVCTEVGDGKCQFKRGSAMSSNDCTTPEGVCIRSFKAAHLNVYTCKKYMCIRGSVKAPQTLCYKDGQCQAYVQPETINDEDCSCRVNLDSGREEWGCGPFK